MPWIQLAMASTLRPCGGDPADVEPLWPAYLETLRGDAGTLLAIAAVAALYAWVWRRARALGIDDHRWFARLLTGLVIAFAIAAGLQAAVEQASMVDDAFISLRYCRNWVDGHGLVWNIGERVEGYTNFLWVATIALVMKLTPWEAPEIALVGCLLSFVANLGVVAAIGHRLVGVTTLRPYLPLATMALAVHWVFTQFATTGMETMAASLLVDLGVLALVSRGGARGAALAGTAWIAAALTRPDHGIFYACGGIAVLVDAVIGYRRAQRDGGATPRALLWTWSKPLLAYAAPFGAYVLYAAWKLHYYGSIIPNTYYAKSADEAYWSQGLIYTAVFYLGSHFWLPVAMLLAFLLVRTRRDEVRRFQVFAALSVVLYTVYVAKVGGDFMYGRFFLTLVPLALLGGEALIHSLAPLRSGARAPVRAVAMVLLVALYAAAAPGLQLFPDRNLHWKIANEGSIYRLETFFPVEVAHPSWRTGVFFGEVLTDRGITPTIAASGIGMLGYYSRLPLVDLRGLTDATIAKRELTQRGRPGHEKWATRDYIHERQVCFIRGRSDGQYREVRKVEFDVRSRHTWLIATYDPELMARIRAEVPEIETQPFEPYLDHYIATLDERKPRQVRRDMTWFRHYYFDHVDDPGRLRPLEEWIEANPVPKKPRKPQGQAGATGPKKPKQPKQPRGPKEPVEPEDPAVDDSDDDPDEEP